MEKNGESDTFVNMKLLFSLSIFAFLCCSFLPQPAEGVIFSMDFEHLESGIYEDAQVRSDWNNPRYTVGVVEARAAIIEGAEAFEGKSLRISFPSGTVGPYEGGAIWRLPLDRSYDEIYCSYRIKFATGFRWVKGGKLPGPGGGQGNTGGDVPTGYDGWSARLMWTREEGVTEYVYHAGQPGTYGDLGYWQENGTDIQLESGRWYIFEQRVKINTPGVADGIIEAWLDGKKVYSSSHYLFRRDSSFAIDLFLFETFFGGASADWASERDEYIYFDEFVISTERTGS
jgi:hypothetical protein